VDFFTVEVNGKPMAVEHRTGKSGLTETHHSWEFELVRGDNNHILDLWHGTLTGSRRIEFDGRVVYEGRKFFDNGSVHAFEFRGTRFEIAIKDMGLSFAYLLKINGESLKPAQRK
jgi:hypothetical protein